MQVDYQYTDRRSRDEPTGEVMALNRDSLRGLRMGDRYQRTTVPKEKSSKKKYIFKYFSKAFFKFLIQFSVNKDDLKHHDYVLGEGTSTYKPRTQETKNTYDVLLAFIQDAIGDQVKSLYL